MLFNPSLTTLFQPRPSERSRVPLIIGYGLASIFLVWVLHDFHIVRALRDISNVDWKWVVIGMGFDILSYGVQALRWKLLLTPFGRVRLTRAVRAVYAGLFANIVFPLRPGEVLRSFLMANSENIKVGRVLGSVGVERLVDLVIATASLAVASLLVQSGGDPHALPTRFRSIADTLGIATLVVLSIIVLLIFYLETQLGNEPLEEEMPKGLYGRIMGALAVLHAMGTAPSFYPAVLLSVLMPFCQVLAVWSVMIAYGLHLSFFAAIVVVLIINLGVSLPNAPANVGSYQFFCVLGLSVFQVDKTTATGFSIFAFLMLTLPFLLLGFVALVRSGLSLHSMREEISHFPSHVRRSPAST